MFLFLNFREPNLRPTTSQLLTHMFFKQIKKSDTLPQYLKGAQTIDSKSGNDFLSIYLLYVFTNIPFFRFPDGLFITRSIF